MDDACGSREGSGFFSEESAKEMRLVVLESPYAGDVLANISYARACVRDCLLRGEAPIASHLLYTQEGILNDLESSEREIGIAAGLVWARHAEASVVYLDRGVSEGMRQGILHARAHGRKVELRSLVESVWRSDRRIGPAVHALGPRVAEEVRQRRAEFQDW